MDAVHGEVVQLLQGERGHRQLHGAGGIEIAGLREAVAVGAEDRTVLLVTVDLGVEDLKPVLGGLSSVEAGLVPWNPTR